VYNFKTVYQKGSLKSRLDQDHDMMLSADIEARKMPIVYNFDHSHKTARPRAIIPVINKWCFDFNFIIKQITVMPGTAGSQLVF
jgi:hypothetical protein